MNVPPYGKGVDGWQSEGGKGKIHSTKNPKHLSCMCVSFAVTVHKYNVCNETWVISTYTLFMRVFCCVKAVCPDKLSNVLQQRVFRKGNEYGSLCTIH